MSALKSPNRNAGSAYNRTVLMSPSRARHFDARMGVEEEQGPSSARLNSAVSANGFIRFVLNCLQSLMRINHAHLDI